MLRCSVCLAVTAEESPRCQGCGEDLLVACPGCGASRDPRALRCGDCGEVLPVPDPELAPVVTAASVASLRAFAHPRDRRDFAPLLESPGTFAVLRALGASALRSPDPGESRELPGGAPASRSPGPGESRDLPPGARALADALGVAPELRVEARGGFRIEGGSFALGRDLLATLAPAELELLVLGGLFSLATGATHHLDLRARAAALDPVGDPELEEGRESLDAWARFHRMSADRFALAVGEGGLPAMAAALLKDAAASGAAPGGVLGRLEALRALGRDGGSPGGFGPYREALEGCPAILERVFELFAFLRSPAFEALRGLDLPGVLGAAPAASPPANAARRDASVTAAEEAREFVPPDAALLGGADRALFYLSAFRGDLVVVGAAGTTRVDLSDHTRLPVRVALGPRGEIWIADAEKAALVRVDLDGAELARVAGPRRPGGLAVDPDGRLVVADLQAARIRVLAPDGRELRELGATLDPPLRGPEGLALPVGLEGFWVSDPDTRRVLRLDPEGAVAVDIGAGAFERPGSLAACPDGGVWVADVGAGRLERYRPDGRRAATVALPRDPGGYQGAVVASRPDGGLVLLDRARARILAWGPELGAPEVLEGVCAPEDRYGYFCDMALGPAPPGGAGEAAEPTRDEEVASTCVRSISS